ncbi:hypothetical protein OH686_19280 [Pseudomonas sp. SO81]|nr:hypothetical protein OH686_19280 [Pseudomonas sp. SO81]
MAEATRMQVDNQLKELEEARSREALAYKAKFAIEARHKMTSSEGVRSKFRITNLGGDALHVSIIASPIAGSLNSMNFALIRRDEVREFEVLIEPGAEDITGQLIILYQDVRHLRYQVLYYFDVEQGRFSKFLETAHSNGSPG